MSFTRPDTFTTRPTLQGTFGMSATTHWLATGTAQSVLERGGNAFDAATAAAFVLHVVEPHLNGPGGDMTGVFSTAEAPGAPVVLMGQGPAPAGATVQHFRAEGLELVPGSGALAAAVPGAVDAWLLLLRDHGTWELAEVLDFAIRYARDGHPVLARVCSTISAVSVLFREHWPTSAELWMPEGRVPEQGELVRNPALCPHPPETGPGRCRPRRSIRRTARAHARGTYRRRPQGMERRFRGPRYSRKCSHPAPPLVRDRPPRRHDDGRHGGFPRVV